MTTLNIPGLEQPLKWAEVAVIDLALLKQTSTAHLVARQLEEALCDTGAFYVKNHGLAEDAISLQRGIGEKFFSLPLETKLKYHDMAKFMRGKSEGYRPISTNLDVTGIPDNIQIYMMTASDPVKDGHHPDPIVSEAEAIEKFIRDCHEQVLFPLHRLIADILEVPNHHFLAEAHSLASHSESQLRYMHYTAHSPSQLAEIGPIYAGAHTDMDVLTLHFRQPIAALQVSRRPRLPSNGESAEEDWQWVRPMEDAIFVNVGDALESMSGGLFKAALHRVHRPPPEQVHLDRLGVLFFSRANNHTSLNPAADSAKLARLGLDHVVHPAIGRNSTMLQWVTKRQKHRQEDDADGVDVEHAVNSSSE